MLHARCSERYDLRQPDIRKERKSLHREGQKMRGERLDRLPWDFIGASPQLEAGLTCVSRGIYHHLK